MAISVLRNLPNSHTLKMQRRLYNNACIGIAKRTLLYTVSQKTSHIRLAIILTCTMRLRQFLVEIIRCTVSHLTCLVLLHCLAKQETQKTAPMVHGACNTVQLLDRYRLPSTEPCSQQSPQLNALITRLGESHSSVSMSCESKTLKKSSSWTELVEFRECTNTAFKGKCIFAFSCLTRQCRNTSY